MLAILIDCIDKMLLIMTSESKSIRLRTKIIYNVSRIEIGALTLVD